MPNAWKQWEGHVIDGKFPLLRYLGGSEHSAVFLTERRLDERLVRAAIKLVHLSPQNVERQLARWQLAKELPHPHLIPLYETGRCEVDGMSLVYVVMEYAEENLAQLLPSRALAPDEAKAMLESALGVLAYLHGRGFVHGRVRPENILATADQLKISSEGLCRAGEPPLRPVYHDAYEAPENAGGILPVPTTLSPACDVWSLGITVVEALTQTRPAPLTDEQQSAVVPEPLPEPFLDIARHCLARRPENRWTVAQVAARLEGRAPVPVVQTTQSAKPQSRKLAETPRPVVQPAGPAAKRRASFAPVAIGFALVLAAFLVAPKLLRHRSEDPQAPATSAQAQVDSPVASQTAPPQRRPGAAFESKAAEEERASKMADPLPTSVHKEIASEDEPDAAGTEGETVAKASVTGLVPGDVAHRTEPEVLQSARDSIRGTVRVVVRVNVDRSGNVEDADLESAGPSKYFARSAVQAAKQWKFTPPTVGSLGVLSTWSLRFEFTRDGTKVVPTQENP